MRHHLEWSCDLNVIFSQSKIRLYSSCPCTSSGMRFVPAPLHQGHLNLKLKTVFLAVATLLHFSISGVENYIPGGKVFLSPTGVAPPIPEAQPADLASTTFSRVYSCLSHCWLCGPIARNKDRKPVPVDNYVCLHSLSSVDPMKKNHHYNIIKVLITVAQKHMWTLWNYLDFYINLS